MPASRDQQSPAGQPSKPAGSGTLDALRRRLTDQSRELDQQAVELVARRAELEKAQQQIEKREGELATRVNGLKHDRALLARQREAARTQLTRDRETLNVRLQELGAKEGELEKRIHKARDDIVAQRARVQEVHAEADARAEHIEAGFEHLKQERADWEARVAPLKAQIEEVKKREITLARRRAEMGEKSARFEQDKQRLIATRDKLEERRGELDRQRREIVEQRDALVQQRDKLIQQRDKIRAFAKEYDARRAEIEQRNEQLAEREGRISEDETRVRAGLERVAKDEAQLVEQRRRARAELEAWRSRAEAELKSRREKAQADLLARQEQADAEFKTHRASVEKKFETHRERIDSEFEARSAAAEAELTEQRTALAALRERNEALDSTLQQRQAELDALQDELEERDTESRQRALAAELDAEEVEKQQVIIELAHDELSGLRQSREREFTEVRQVLSRRAAQVEEARKSMLAAPKWWPLRAAGIAAVFAFVSAGLWLWRDQPMFRSSTRIAITTTTPYVEQAVREHAIAILSTEAVKEWLSDAMLAADWREACEIEAVRTHISVDPAAVELSLRHVDARRANRLLAGAAKAYVRHVNGVAPMMLLPAAYRDLSERRTGVGRELRQTRERLAESKTLLALQPPAADRDGMIEQVEQLGGETRQTAADLTEQRRTLVGLEADSRPISGMLAQGELEFELKRDEIYQSSRTEINLVARQFRAELKVAMAPLDGKLTDVVTAAEALTTALTEKRREKPAAGIAAVLEECTLAAEEFLDTTAAFKNDWSGRGRSMDRIQPDDVVALVEGQTAAAIEAERMAEAAVKLHADVREQLKSLEHQAGGATRVLVVTNALRRDVSHLGQAVATFGKSAAAISQTGNFRIKASDMRLRGLRTGLMRRRETVRRRLQQEADLTAGQRRQTTLAAIRKRVRELEETRDDLATALTEASAALRQADEDLLERRQIENDIRRDNAETRRLAAQLGRLDQELAVAKRTGPQPDRARLEPIRDVQIAGAHRVQIAAAVGGAGFVFMWLLCVLMLLKNPFRRRGEQEDPVSKVLSPVAGVPAEAGRISVAGGVKA